VKEKQDLPRRLLRAGSHLPPPPPGSRQYPCTGRTRGGNRTIGTPTVDHQDFVPGTDPLPNPGDEVADPVFLVENRDDDAESLQKPPSLAGRNPTASIGS
jgi:hypothetical protein